MINEQLLTIDSDTFLDLKIDFNNLLKKTVNNMMDMDNRHGEITIKLKIDLDERVTEDFDGEERNIISPTFTHKVSSVLQTKCEQNGILCGDYELIFSDMENGYVLCPIKKKQISVFDEGYVEPQL